MKKQDRYLLIRISASAVLLAACLLLDYAGAAFFTPSLRLLLYLAAYLPLAVPLLVEAAESLGQGDYFNEFTLMLLATAGALLIGELPEAVAVLLFYCVGEWFQERAVERVQGNIKSLLDLRPQTARIGKGGKWVEVVPESIKVGDRIQIRAGERAPVDGLLLSGDCLFDTAALTGESMPRTVRRGEKALAGMVSVSQSVEMEACATWANSALAKILYLVEEATARKAKGELLLRRFARIYTPAVFALALVVAFVPAIFVPDYSIGLWGYRALVFLVISCPCALVISVPLSYFAGIGAAAHNGILIKGASYLDILKGVNTIVLDKTGTLTEGIFAVRKTEGHNCSPEWLLQMAASIERFSTHPIAQAIVKHYNSDNYAEVSEVKEIAGMGITALCNGKATAVGNGKLLNRLGINFPPLPAKGETAVLLAHDGKYCGAIFLGDGVKADSAATIKGFYEAGIRECVLLSGDSDDSVQRLAGQLNITRAEGELLPEDKLARLQQLKSEKGVCVAFVGDGINDTPSLAAADVGIAMGALGSEAAIEVADIVIQTDQPSKILTAIRISERTRRVIVQNIAFALAVKFAVMLLGVLGVATLWEAVFADVGVSLLAILNALRLLKMRY